MQLASNKFSDMRLYYHRELDALYGSDEVEAMLAVAAAHYLNWSHHEVRLRGNDHINQSALIDLYDCAKGLKRGEPLHYLLGETWFMGLKFRVDQRVLIPRPETEELVDLILKDNPALSSLLDIGTGSGCIPISIKAKQPGVRAMACDISAGALELAATNARLNRCDVQFVQADVLNPTAFTTQINTPVELVVSNPPYIAITEKQQMAAHVLNHEPHLALFVEGADAIVFYRRIIDLCSSLLVGGGRLYFELNPLTAEMVRDDAQASGLFVQVQLLNDMSGKVRFLKAIRK